MPYSKRYDGPERRSQRQTVKQAVHETLTTIGFDLTDANGCREDIRFMRRLRTGVEATKTGVWRAVIAFVIPAALVYLWMAVTGKSVP